MAFTLDDRSALRRAFYRLTGTSSGDDALEEHDNETNEAVHYHLQHGLWDAQSWLIATVDPYRWISISDPITSWTGTDDTTGGRYTTLPADFLRLAGDADTSALRGADGEAWGVLLDDPRRRFDIAGDAYYLVDEQLWITKRAAPPATLYLHYHERHPVLEDDVTTIDFPILDRPLIVGFAGQSYAAEASLPGGQEMVGKIDAYLDRAKRLAVSRGRRTHEPLKLRPRDTFGTQFFV